jgi:hypothetical protein
MGLEVSLAVVGGTTGAPSCQAPTLAFCFGSPVTRHSDARRGVACIKSRTEACNGEIREGKKLHS